MCWVLCNWRRCNIRNSWSSYYSWWSSWFRNNFILDYHNLFNDSFHLSRSGIWDNSFFFFNFFDWNDFMSWVLCNWYCFHNNFGFGYWNFSLDSDVLASFFILDNDVLFNFFSNWYSLMGGINCKRNSLFFLVFFILATYTARMIPVPLSFSISSCFRIIQFLFRTSSAWSLS